VPPVAIRTTTALVWSTGALVALEGESTRVAGMKPYLHEAQRVQLAQAAGRALLVRLARIARRLKHRCDEHMQMPAAAARLLRWGGGGSLPQTNCPFDLSLALIST
jgi:hypothetical protein